MAAGPLDRILRPSSDSVRWQVISRGPPVERPLAAAEECRWRDPIGNLKICYVSSDDGAFYRLWQGDEICVDVLTGRRLEVRSIESLPPHVVDHFVTDQVIPRALADEGLLVLHAGGVRIGSEAILIMGESGRGKSTLVASFNQENGDLIGDDAIIVLRGTVSHEARAVYPSLRLFQDSIKAILPDGALTHAVTQNASKRRIDVPVSSTSTSAPLPVAALFILAAPVAESDIHVRPLSISEICMAAIENSFLIDPSDVSRAQTQLSLASALAREVPAFGISYPRDYARLSEVRARMMERVSGLR